MKTIQKTRIWRPRRRAGLSNALDQLFPSFKHPDHSKNLGYKIARVLFLAGVTSVEHTVFENKVSDITEYHPPLHEHSIEVRPNIRICDVNVFLGKDFPIKLKLEYKDESLIYYILREIGIGITGTAYREVAYVSNVERADLLKDIVLQFHYFQRYFIIEQ